MSGTDVDKVQSAQHGPADGRRKCCEFVISRDNRADTCSKVHVPDKTADPRAHALPLTVANSSAHTSSYTRAHTVPHAGADAAAHAGAHTSPHAQANSIANP
jgi:hypothetical protein